MRKQITGLVTLENVGQIQDPQIGWGTYTPDDNGVDIETKYWSGSHDAPTFIKWHYFTHQQIASLSVYPITDYNDEMMKTINRVFELLKTLPDHGDMTDLSE